MDPRKISSRKEQRIKQLVAAKDQILSELALYENSQHSVSTAKSQRRKPQTRQLPRLQDGRTSTAQSIYSETYPSSQQQQPNFMFNLPTTGGGSLKKRGIRLPIFRLPTPDLTLVELNNQLQQASQTTTDPTTLSPAKSPKKQKNTPFQNSFIPCRDKRFVKKSFLLLLQQLLPEEKIKIANMLALPPSEIDQIIAKLQETSKDETNNDLFSSILVPNDHLTIFLAAKFYLIQQRGNIGNMSLITRSSSFNDYDGGTNNALPIVKIDALRAASHEMDFNTIGITNNFKNFLLLENVPMTAASQASRDNLFTSASTVSNNNSFDGLESMPGMTRAFSLPSIDKRAPSSQQHYHPPSSAFGYESSLASQSQAFLTSSANSSFYLPPASRNNNQRLGTAVSMAPKTNQGARKALTRDHSQRGMFIPPTTAQTNRAPTALSGTVSQLPSITSTSQGPRKPPAYPSSTSSVDPSQSSDPNLLSSELLKSLLNVQKHTNLVKRTLETAQNFITMGEFHNNQLAPPGSHSNSSNNLTANTKAKEVLFILASQKLAKALYKLCLLDCKKGFISWKMFIFQTYRANMIKSLIRFVNCRNLIVGFNRIVHRILTKSFQIWIKQVHEMNILMRRQKILDSIIKIQSFFRQMLAKEKVRVRRHRKKYEMLYDATIKIQALLRGKRMRWKYLKQQRDKKEYDAATKIQTIFRGYLAKKRVKLMKMRKNKNLAAVVIQKIVRGKITRNLYKRLIYEYRRRVATVRIQALVRGFITRKNIATLLINRARFEFVVKIQKIMRGYLTRKNLQKKLQELQEYKEMRIRSVVKIQSAYRMYRAKIMYRIMALQRKLELNKHNRAATQINKIVRGFLARRLKVQLLQERMDNWIAQARLYTEIWSDDTQSYFYYNNQTGESIWEPDAGGYVRHDGKLVLQSGEIIDDPDAVDEAAAGGGGNNPFEDLLRSGDQQEKKKQEKKKTKKELKKLCNECSERIAIRLCNECGDQFCTKCYKSTHMLGARRHHTFKLIGPKDCNECENVLAIRFCVTCDENYCDKCWRKLHSHGKRVFHPYAEVSAEGRVAQRIFTMDGDQMEEGYDATYAQQRVESSQVQQQSSVLNEQEEQMQQQFWEEQEHHHHHHDDDYQQGGDYYDDQQQADQYQEGAGGEGGGGEEWSQYYDENGYLYYYNNYTGQSQYDNPYES